MDNKLINELVSSLEAVKKYHVTDRLVLKQLADLVQKYQITDLSLLNKLTESLLSISAGSKQVEQLDLNPQSLLEAEILEKEISPWVAEIRKGIFGKEEPPFADRDSSLAWLSGYKVSEKDLIRKLLEVKKSSFGKEATLRIAVMEGMSFLPDTPPSKIYDKTDEISDNTGIRPDSLVMHILMNGMTIRDKLKMKTSNRISFLPSDKKIEVKSFTVTYTDSLSFEDMRKIYKTIKAGFKHQKSKQINAKHLELYKLVNESGIPTGRGKVDFWKQITEEWNTRHPKEKFSTWKGVDVAYTRLMKKMSRLVINEESAKGANNERTH